MTANAQSEELRQQPSILRGVLTHMVLLVAAAMAASTSVAQGTPAVGVASAPSRPSSAPLGASAPPSAVPALPASAPRPDGLLDTFARVAQEHGLVDKLLGVIALGLGLWLTRVRASLSRLRAGFVTLRSGLPVSAENRFLKVCILGLGGVGKTTIVRTFTLCPDADPAVSTDSLRRFTTINEYAGPASRFGMRIDWYDSAGQNPAQITFHTRADAVLDADVERPSDTRRDFDLEPFDAVVLVLDLFDPPDAGSMYSTTFANWDRQRLAESLKQWSPVAISAIKGALGDRVRYVCVFVNKFNLLAAPTAAEHQAILLKVRPYVNSIAPMFRGAEVDLFVGSALGDANTATIRAKLQKHGRDLNGG